MNHPATAAIDRDDRPRLERADHERIAQQLVQVRERVERDAVSSRPRRLVAVAVVVVRRSLGLTDDDEPAVGGAEHLDRDAVERGSGSRS